MNRPGHPGSRGFKVKGVFGNKARAARDLPQVGMFTTLWPRAPAFSRQGGVRVRPSPWAQGCQVPGGQHGVPREGFPRGHREQGQVRAWPLPSAAEGVSSHTHIKEPDVVL